MERLVDVPDAIEVSVLKDCYLIYQRWYKTKWELLCIVPSEVLAKKFIEENKKDHLEFTYERKHIYVEDI